MELSSEPWFPSMEDVGHPYYLFQDMGRCLVDVHSDFLSKTWEESLGTGCWPFVEALVPCGALDALRESEYAAKKCGNITAWSGMWII